LDNVPEGLNDAAIANVKFSQAQARDMQGDLVGALAYVKEANDLAPENISYLRALASLEPEIGSYDSSINAYLRYIDILKAGITDYYSYSNVASVYLDLGDIYTKKYNADMAKVPLLPQPELDEEGNEIPLDAEQEAEKAAAQKEYDAAIALAEASKTAADNAAVQAENYFQQALDNAPASLSNADIANIKIGQAGAREARGDIEGAIAFINEARNLDPQNANYLMYMATLEQSRDNEEKARELFLEARAMAPDNYDIAYTYAQSLLYSDNPADSVAEMKAYRDALPEGHPSIDQADQAISTLQMYADIFASFNTSNIEIVDDEHDHDHEDEGQEIEDPDIIE